MTLPCQFSISMKTTTKHLKLNVSKTEVLTPLPLPTSVILSLLPISQNSATIHPLCLVQKSWSYPCRHSFSYNPISNLAVKLAVSTFKNFSYRFHPTTAVQKSIISYLDYCNNVQINKPSSSTLTDLRHIYFPHSKQCYPLIYKPDYHHHSNFLMVSHFNSE